MKTKKAPPPPDPEKLIKAQAESNAAAADRNRTMNNIDIRGPTGNVSYTTGPDGRMVQTTELNQNQQTALDAQQATTSKLSQVADEMAGNINAGAFGINPNLPSRVTSLDTTGMKDLGSQDYSVARDKYANDMFSRAKLMLDPQFDEQERTLNQRLSDQGLPITGEAYDHDMGKFRDSRNKAYEDAAFAATQAGAQEESRIFGLDNAANQSIIQRQQADAALRDSARNSGIQEDLQVYNAPVQRIAQLYGAAPQTPTVNTPGFATSNEGAVDSAGITTNAYNQQVANINQQNANKMAMLQAGVGLIGDLGGAAITKSDENAKENFGSADSILDRVEQIPVSSWNYKEEERPLGDNGERHVGPMAQDFKGFFGLGDGKNINMVDAFGVNLSATKELAKKVRALEARAS